MCERRKEIILERFEVKIRVKVVSCYFLVPFLGSLHGEKFWKTVFFWALLLKSCLKWLPISNVFFLFSFLASRLGKTLFLGSAGVTSGSQQRMIVKEIKQLLDDYFASFFIWGIDQELLGQIFCCFFFSIKISHILRSTCKCF